MSALSDQDQRYASQGFCFEQNFETPYYTETEKIIMSELIVFVMEHGPKDLAKSFRPDMAFGLFYHHFRALRSDGVLAQFDQQKGTDHTELYRKIECNASYQGYKDWIISEGGETREGYVYEEDEETIRPEWIRFYSK